MSDNEAIGALLVGLAEAQQKVLSKFANDLALAVERPYREVGWLIERAGQWYAAAPHSDWTIKQAINDLHAENWTHDANEALRFARKVDAETLIRFVGWQHATATEHAFISTGGPDGR